MEWSLKKYQITTFVDLIKVQKYIKITNLKYLHIIKSYKPLIICKSLGNIIVKNVFLKLIST